MQNHVITNKQESVLDMSPLKDANGLALALRPRGQKGDSKEITAEVAESEIVARVKKAGWVDVRPVGAAPADPPPAPTPKKTSSAAPPPAPTPSPTPAAAPPLPPAPEPTKVMPVAETAALVEQSKEVSEATKVMPSSEVAALAEQAKAPESAPDPSSKRSRK